jgi:hypothetical protein
MTFMNRFEGYCGTFGKEKKTQHCQQHWVNLPYIYIYIYLFMYLFIYKKINDYGMDVNKIIVIYLRHIEKKWHFKP